MGARLRGRQPAACAGACAGARSPQRWCVRARTQVQVRRLSTATDVNSAACEERERAAVWQENGSRTKSCFTVTNLHNRLPNKSKVSVGNALGRSGRQARRSPRSSLPFARHHDISMFSKRFPKLSAALFGTEPGPSEAEYSAEAEQPHYTHERQPQQPHAASPAPAAARSIDDLKSSQPLVIEAPLRDGGTQGLQWVEQTLRTDEDGDEAHGFISVERGA